MLLVLGFDIKPSDDVVQLQVTAPPGAEAMLDALVATFQPTSAGGLLAATHRHSY